MSQTLVHSKYNILILLVNVNGFSVRKTIQKVHLYTK